MSLTARLIALPLVSFIFFFYFFICLYFHFLFSSILFILFFFFLEKNKTFAFLLSWYFFFFVFFFHDWRVALEPQIFHSPGSWLVDRICQANHTLLQGLVYFHFRIEAANLLHSICFYSQVFLVNIHMYIYTLSTQTTAQNTKKKSKIKHKKFTQNFFFLLDNLPINFSSFFTF